MQKREIKYTVTSENKPDYELTIDFETNMPPEMLDLDGLIGAIDISKFRKPIQT
jgi:hypothetical protein